MYQRRSTVAHVFAMLVPNVRRATPAHRAPALAKSMTLHKDASVCCI